MKSKTKRRKLKKFDRQKNNTYYFIIIILIFIFALSFYVESSNDDEIVPRKAQPPCDDNMVCEKCGNVVFYERAALSLEWEKLLSEVEICAVRTKGGSQSGGVNLNYALKSIANCDYIGATKTNKRLCGFVTIIRRNKDVADMHVVCAQYKTGKILIQGAIDFCTKEKFKFLILEALNKDLVKVYEKFGFKPGWGNNGRIVERWGQNIIQKYDVYGKLLLPNTNTECSIDDSVVINEDGLYPMYQCLS